ncbi:MAG: hypothetical protein EZS28_049730 [Streblomastix strix]|uniref:Uncharacterized protein n=1 Tax=Streblomastix strix TaxID=222440 RepID=A0A5J4TA90_9EUKA|nr:MAG: hypothetical protein EZS28_049730 [Streblomastix strix]
METKTNLSTQSNPSTSLMETMDSEGMTAGRSYRPLSTEKRIPISISKKYTLMLNFTIQTGHIESEETVVGRNYRQQPTKMDIQTVKQSITLEETLAMLRTISPGYPRGYKEKEPERKYPKLQQYIGLIDVIERFYEIMKSIINEEKMKPKIILPGQYKEYSNKDDPAFFYPRKNYRPAQIFRPKDLNLSEEQLNYFDRDVREGVIPILSLTNRQPQSQGESLERIIYPRITKHQ